MNSCIAREQQVKMNYLIQSVIEHLIQEGSLNLSSPTQDLSMTVFSLQQEKYRMYLILPVYQSHNYFSRSENFKPRCPY